MNKKIKVLTLSDHPLSPSGVGTQTKYMIEGLLATGRFEVISLGGAVKHQNYQPMKTEEWGDDWVIFPVDGYGTQDIIRSILRNEKPDILWFMTDPRFYGWLWQMEDEIRPLVPMVYYHVWDNYPPPKYNKVFYDSTDVIVTISRLTDEITRLVTDTPDVVHLPHAVDTEIFQKLDNETMAKFRQDSLAGDDNKKKMIFFWNNRNARRKQSGTLIWWFKDFLDRVGHDSATLIMHTDPRDQHGQDLEAIIHELGLHHGQVKLSRDKVSPKALAHLYNLADCTINISDAEGFGLATLESLACETPIIVTMTGGLQEQVTDGENWFGYGIEPSSQSVIGSQQIPWIFEDRINGKEFVDTLEKFYNLSADERAELGKAGRAHVESNYSFEKYQTGWDELLTKVHETHGSWDTRKGYNSWRAEEL
jgi:glycosyltransferase involved in cell wall biosynthesis